MLAVEFWAKICVLAFVVGFTDLTNAGPLPHSLPHTPRAQQLWGIAVETIPAS